MNKTLNLPRLVPAPDELLRKGRAIGQHGLLAAVTLIVSVVVFAFSEVAFISAPGFLFLIVSAVLLVFSTGSLLIGLQCGEERNRLVLMQLDFMALIAPEIGRFGSELDTLQRKITRGEARQVLGLCSRLMSEDFKAHCKDAN